MSKSIKKEKVSKGRNWDLCEMFANPSGSGKHVNSKDKRKNNPKNRWEAEEQG